MITMAWTFCIPRCDTIWASLPNTRPSTHFSSLSHRSLVRSYELRPMLLFFFSRCLLFLSFIFSLLFTVARVSLQNAFLHLVFDFFFFFSVLFLFVHRFLAAVVVFFFNFLLCFLCTCESCRLFELFSHYFVFNFEYHHALHVFYIIHFPIAHSLIGYLPAFFVQWNQRKLLILSVIERRDLNRIQLNFKKSKVKSMQTEKLNFHWNMHSDDDEPEGWKFCLRFSCNSATNRIHIGIFFHSYLLYELQISQIAYCAVGSRMAMARTMELRTMGWFKRRYKCWYNLLINKNNYGAMRSEYEYYLLLFGTAMGSGRRLCTWSLEQNVEELQIEYQRICFASSKWMKICNWIR